MLTQDQIAYGQQKNREHIWNQAKLERMEYKALQSKFYKEPIKPWNDLDEDMTCVRYESLCQNSNITPW